MKELMEEKMDRDNLVHNIQPKFCKCCGKANLIKAGEKDEYVFWKCQRCDFIFTDVDYHKMVETYENGYHSIKDGAPDNGWAKSIEFLTPAICRLPNNQLKILDFGCGESLIPKKLRESSHKVIGVDIVPPYKDHPDRFTGDILDLYMPINNFDLIYSFQVFEHISEPVPIIQKLVNLARVGGLLLIHTDMETAERFSGRFTDWWYVLPPDHCSFYRHKTFQELFDQVNCDIIYKNPHVVLARKNK